MSFELVNSTRRVETDRMEQTADPLSGDPSTMAAPPNRRSRRLSVLAIGLPSDHVIDGIALTHAAEPRDVIEMLRVMDFSLLLVRAGPKDTAAWEMVRAVRRYWPQLRWALLSEDCTNEVEIRARSLGAASVTGDARVIAELASRRRCK